VGGGGGGGGGGGWVCVVNRVLGGFVVEGFVVKKSFVVWLVKWGCWVVVVVEGCVVVFCVGVVVGGVLVWGDVGCGEGVFV